MKGEISLGQFLEAEQVRNGAGAAALRRRIHKGFYRKAIKVRKVNERVTMIRIVGKLPSPAADFRPGRSGCRGKVKRKKD